MIATTPMLNKFQREMLDDQLAKVEAIKEQRRTLAAEVTERMESLAQTFGTDAVEYENEQGRTIRFRLVTSKRTSYKAVVTEVKNASSKPMQQFIDRTIEENTTTAQRKVLTATAPKKGRKPALTPSQVKGIRQSLRHKTHAQVATQYGISQPTVGRIARREGAYAKG